MDRYEALYQFWASFGIPAFEENSVPTGGDYPGYPYITYEAAVGGFDSDVIANGYIWTRSPSWLEADTLADTIEASLKNGGMLLPYTGGAIWITAEPNFAQNMGDQSDNMIKRKILNVTYHYS